MTTLSEQVSSAVTTLENSASKARSIVETDAIINTQAGQRKSLPMLIREAESDFNSRMAAISAGVYANTALGLAATPSGKYFSVPGPSVNDYLILYFNNSGVAVEIKRYPSKEYIDGINTDVNASTYAQRIYETADGGTTESHSRQKFKDLGYVPNRLQQNVTAAGGEVAVGTLDASGKLIAGIGEMGLIAGENSIQDRDPIGSEIYAITDESDRGAVVIREGGLVEVATRKAWDLPEIVHIISYGQSLSIGVNGTPVVSLSQPHNNLMFNGGVEPGTNAANVTGFSPLVSQSLETVLPGCCNRLVELGNDAQFVGTATGIGNTPIEGLTKGTAGYAKTLFVKQPAVDCGRYIDKSYSMGAILWMQGEANISSMFTPFWPALESEYAAKLAQLWRDLNADFSEINDIGSPIPLITYQLSFGSKTVSADGVTQAQLNLSNTFDHIYCAGPTYPMVHGGDTIHLTGPSYFIYGHYFARVLNEVINGRDWKPVHIKSARRAGKGLLLKYHVPTPPLQIAPFKGVPTTDAGFAVYDAAGNKLTISSLTLSGVATVKIMLTAAPSGPVLIKYARDYSNSECNCASAAAGDIRDSNTEIITYTVGGTPYTEEIPNYGCHQMIWSN